MTTPPPAKRSRRIYWLWGVALTLLLAAGAFCWTVVVPVWVTPHSLTITEAGDYIVPGSVLNTIRYRWRPLAQPPDSVRMEIRDKDGALVRKMTYLPTTLPANKGYAQHQWNGLDDSGLALTEGKAPYTIILAARWGSREELSKLGCRRVKSTSFMIRLSDEPAYEGALVSGVDIASVTKKDNLYVIWRRFHNEGGQLEEIPAYGVTEEGVHADVLLKSGPRPSDILLFYTTPTVPADVKIRYELIQKVSPLGCRDKAGNQWDMDGATPNVWENKGIWVFGVDERGRMTHFTETYVVDE